VNAKLFNMELDFPEETLFYLDENNEFDDGEEWNDNR
jgi:hypothetical protein